MGPDEQREPTPPPQLPPPSPGINNPWALASMWVGIAIVLVTGIVLMFRACVSLPERALQKTSETIEKAGETLATVASAFSRGTITTSFVSYATSITNSQHLQFATLKQMEMFTRTEEPSTAFGYLPLPAVEVEARAPVEYTYFLDLNAKWEFVVRDGVLHVYAPPIRANRPSVDVSALDYQVKRGRFRTTEVIESLKKNITSLAILRAKENIPLVRETGRRETAEFVEKWLSRSFSDGNNYPVKVYFPGEGPPDEIKVAPGTNMP